MNIKMVINMTALALPLFSQETSLSRYLSEIKKFPILSPKEENDIAISWFEKADLIAAQKLIVSHLKLVAKIAFQFKGYGLPMADIVSEGNIGLLTAVKKFNPYKGFRLATYAKWWIKATIQDYILKSWSIVKMGTTAAHKKLFFNLKKIKKKLFNLYQGQLPINEVELIANELGVSQKNAKEMNNRFTNDIEYLNTTIYQNDDIELLDNIVEEGNDQEVMLIEEQERSHKKQKFKQAFALLNAREQDIIQERRLKDKATTLEALSQKYKISGEAIRLIEKKAMIKLQEAVQA